MEAIMILNDLRHSFYNEAQEILKTEFKQGEIYKVNNPFALNNDLFVDQFEIEQEDESNYAYIYCRDFIGDTQDGMYTYELDAVGMARFLDLLKEKKFSLLN